MSAAETVDPEVGPQLREALGYAARCWPVFPCRPDKRPLTAHGFKEASCDAVTIEAWWRRWPQANVAIATGEAGLVVVDVDVKNGALGAESWAALKSELGGDLEDTAIALTPSGGRHLYYQTSESQITSSAGRLASGIDVRARGGYVVAPPSRDASGAAYEWLADHGLKRLEELPRPLVERLLTREGSIAVGASAAAVFAAGERNHRLTSLAGSMRRHGMSQDVIEAALLAENAARCEPPLPAAEVRAVAVSVSRYPAGAQTSRGTDSDNAERFIALFGERVRYCALEKSWYVYDGRRWQRDERLGVEELMRRALLSIFAEAAQATSDAGAKSSGRSALRLQSAHARRAALECARSDPRIAVHPTDFDHHPWLLNCENGTLDLRSGDLRPHDPADLIRQLAPVAYAADARHETWERFVSEATGGDVDLLEYLQRAVGYTLTGDTGERVFFLVLGPTTTGKSTFVEALVATLGDYAHPAGIEAFLRRTSVGGARPEIAALAGRRLVTGIEVDKKRHLDEVLVKQIVGGDTVSERDLYARAVPFRPQCTLWFAANEAPRMSDTDDALWVRACEIPFTCQVPEKRKDPRVKATLRDPGLAGPAILAWAVRGCREWQRHGLGTTHVVQQATQELRLSMDPLSDFLDECCCLDPETFASNRDLRCAYRDWLAQWGRADRMGPKEWGQRLRAHGLEPDKESGQRGYRGICLRATAAA